MAGRDWIWIAGNHDPRPLALGGRHLRRARASGRSPSATPPRPGAGARRGLRPLPPEAPPAASAAGAVARPCFLVDGRRLILPAFGAYTGGLCADSPAFAALLGPGARAVLTGDALRRRAAAGARLMQPRNPDFDAVVRASFARQGMMRLLEATIADLAPGRCMLSAPIRPETSQQHGFAHAGLAWSLGDSAAGYAALSLLARATRS